MSKLLLPARSSSRAFVEVSICSSSIFRTGSIWASSGISATPPPYPPRTDAVVLSASELATEEARPPCREGGGGCCMW